MSNFAISTATMLGGLRLPIQQIQTQLTRAQTELASGRHADVGLTLGTRTSSAAALHGLGTWLDAFADANATISTRLTATQSALTTVSETAQSLQKQVVAALAGTITSASLASAASAGLSDVTSALNTDVGGQRLFAGINTDVKPFADDGAKGMSAVASAFVTVFGMAAGDDAASSITSASMQNFLDGAFADGFASPAWQSDWSSASAAITTRITPTRVATTSVTINDPALRSIVQVSAMLSGVGLSSLSADARNAVLTKAQAMLGQATSDIAGLQATVGTMQNTVSDATDGVESARRFVSTQIGTMEEVDAADVSTRIASLTTQLESAYSLTSRISQLSLVKYLP